MLPATMKYPKLMRSDATAESARWWRGWLPLFLLPAVVFLLTPAEWPRWGLMWLLAVAVYFACKWLTWRRTPASGAPLWKHVGYLLTWPGMDAEAFFYKSAAVARPSIGEWLFATAKLAAGVAWLFGVVRLVPPQYPYVVGWAGMIGMGFILHFGLFHVLSCAWRSLDVDARPLMNWPVAATSLSDYWGRRWNTAFRDLAHRFLFRPLASRLGPRWAILAGFLFSGILHDLVISLPAGGGYCGPTAFFMLQGGAIFLERTRQGRRMGLGRGSRGWLFTMLAVLLPAALLFHPPFVLKIVVPFLQAIGAAA